MVVWRSDLQFLVLWQNLQIYIQILLSLIGYVISQIIKIIILFQYPIINENLSSNLLCSSTINFLQDLFSYIISKDLSTSVLWSSTSLEVPVSSHPLLDAPCSPLPIPACTLACLMCRNKWLPCYCPLGMDRNTFHCQHLHGWMSALGYCWTHDAPTSSSVALCHCNSSFSVKSDFFNIKQTLYSMISISIQNCASQSNFFPRFLQSWKWLPRIHSIILFLYHICIAEHTNLWEFMVMRIIYIHTFWCSFITANNLTL